MAETTNHDIVPRPTSGASDDFRRAFLHELHNRQGTGLSAASPHDLYQAAASAVRHHLMNDWLRTVEKDRDSRDKAVCYLSAEYLLGPQLDNAILAADLV